MNSNEQTQNSSVESEERKGSIEQQIEKLDAANSASTLLTWCFDKLFRKQGFINRIISSSLGILYKTISDHDEIIKRNNELIDELREQSKEHLTRTESLEHNLIRIDELEHNINASFNSLKIIDRDAKDRTQRVSKLEELYYKSIETTSNAHERSLRTLESTLSNLENTVKESKQRIEESHNQYAEKHQNNHKQITELRSLIQEIENSQNDLQGELHTHAINLRNNNPILDKLHQAHQLKTDKETRFREYFDPFYSSFEENYRGSRKTITDRLKGYESLILEAAANFNSNYGSSDAPIAIDLGCGRGEWLEVVGGYKILSLGVDTNKQFIEECTIAGHNVVLGDAVSELEKIGDDSLAIISAFHLVEHLEFDYLLQMFKECYRTLVPGGILIFETPNPENLLVSTQSFYLDPTHKNPIPPALLEFCSVYSGFKRVDRSPSSPYSKDHHLPGNAYASKKLNELLYGPQDYAIISRK